MEQLCSKLTNRFILKNLGHYHLFTTLSCLIYLVEVKELSFECARVVETSGLICHDLKISPFNFSFNFSCQIIYHDKSLTLQVHLKLPLYD